MWWATFPKECSRWIKAELSIVQSNVNVVVSKRPSLKSPFQTNDFWATFQMTRFDCTRLSSEALTNFVIIPQYRNIWAWGHSATPKASNFGNKKYISFPILCFPDDLLWMNERMCLSGIENFNCYERKFIFIFCSILLLLSVWVLLTVFDRGDVRWFGQTTGPELQQVGRLNQG